MFLISFFTFVAIIDVCSLSLISLVATPLIQTLTSHPGWDGTTSHYPDGNYTQDWYITTNWINHTIKINFASCVIENAKGVCLYDFLYVYDGPDSNSTEMLKTCCGTVHTAKLESSTGEMYIYFATDNTIGDTGFEIEYWSNGITTTTTTTAAPTTTTDLSSTLQKTDNSGAGDITSTAQTSDTVIFTSTMQISDTAISTSTMQTSDSAISTSTMQTSDSAIPTSTMQTSDSEISTSTLQTSDSAISTSAKQTSDTSLHTSILQTDTTTKYSTQPNSTAATFYTNDSSSSGYTSADSYSSSSVMTNTAQATNTQTSDSSIFYNIIQTGSTAQASKTPNSNSSFQPAERTTDPSNEQTFSSGKVTGITLATKTRTNTVILNDLTSELSTQSSASANTEADFSTLQGSTIFSQFTNTTLHKTIEGSSKDNTLYIIIACVVTLVLIIIVVILIVVVCLKKNNKSSTWPQPFLVHEEGKQGPKKTTFVQNKMALSVPRTPPLNTVMPETNLFDLELPDKARGNLLPPLYSSNVEHLKSN